MPLLICTYNMGDHPILQVHMWCKCFYILNKSLITLLNTGYCTCAWGVFSVVSQIHENTSPHLIFSSIAQKLDAYTAGIIYTIHYRMTSHDISIYCDGKLGGAWERGYDISISPDVNCLVCHKNG